MRLSPDLRAFGDRLTHSYAETTSWIGRDTRPAWLWDLARRRIVFANDAALHFWREASLDDLLERRFGADEPQVQAMASEGSADLGGARARISDAQLRDGRPGRLIVILSEVQAQPDPADDAFQAAPLPMAVFDAQGRRVRSNAEADALLMPGELGIVCSSPYVARDLLTDTAARGTLTRTIAVATRFGLRRCRVSARQAGSAAQPTVIVAFDDVEDRLSLAEETARVLAPPPPPLPAPETSPDAVAPSVTAAPVVPASTAVLDEVVAALRDATLAADSAGLVIAMNARAAQLLGESARGEPLLNMLPPELKADAAAYIAHDNLRGLEQALETGRETRILRGDGEVPVRTVFSRLATGEILVQFVDLSAVRASEDALRQARAEAEESSQHKTDFLAGISHELRTPLNAIIGFAEIMEQQRFGPIGTEKYREYVHDIRTSGELLLSLINDLLDLSKAESGRIELDPDAVEIKPIIMSVLSLLSPQADRFGVTLRASVPRDIPAIVADQRSLKQILLNLAGNAVKFNREAGEVEVGAMMDAAGAVHIEVRDTGPGMDADELRRALEPYRRTKSGRGREGTGLGLPLARALIEANKAQFSVQSAPGQGTVMRLTFPSTLVLAG